MANESKSRSTTSVPVTTMEDIPVLSEREREDLIGSLKAAQADIKAGKSIDYESRTFKKRLLDIFRAAKR
jgi:hypothetical protein